MFLSPVRVTNGKGHEERSGATTALATADIIAISIWCLARCCLVERDEDQAIPANTGRQFRQSVQQLASEIKGLVEERVKRKLYLHNRLHTRRVGPDFPGLYDDLNAFQLLLALVGIHVQLSSHIQSYVAL